MASLRHSDQSLDLQGSRPVIQAALKEVETINKPTVAGSGMNNYRGGTGANGGGEDGVVLSWMDLWVRVADRKNGSRSILQGLTGYVRPAELLAIMGPSGCGKSTLLDTLAGRLARNAKQEGDILINGRKQALAYGTSAYVTEDDALMATLTVREAVYYSAQLQLPDTMSKSEKEERAEMTIREMGLHNAMSTRIGGGWGVKGLSGGEKRRVSICIEILTRPKLLFLDEPTSGLDSAASYYVMTKISSLLNGKDGIKRTIVLSIHQPSTEIFQLFHNLFLLSAGKTVYFGPASAANDFFALNGFPCPALQNPSDHFLKTINKDFDKDIEQGFANGIPTEEVINILVQSYKSSDICQQVQREVAQICKQDAGAMERTHATFFTQCNVLTRRSFINMYRDIGYYWLRLAFYIAIGLGLGTIFTPLGMSYDSIQARGGLVMFVTVMLTFMTIGGFPSFVEEMKVFQRERLNGHCGSIAFVFANTFSALPFLVVISIITGAVSYYIPGLHKGYDRFLFFVATLFASMMLVESLMMIVASLIPNFLMGIIVGGGIQGLLVLVGGFVRLPNKFPKPFWRYPLHYVAFHKYVFQGLLKNEFEGLTFPNIQAGQPPTLTGEEILRNIWHVEMAYSKWIDLVILFAMVVLYRFIFLCIIKTTEKVKTTVAKF